VNRVCPTCRFEYGGGEVFCPVDAARLVTTSQMGAQPVDPEDPLIGTLLAGRYEVKRRIGEGGMGLVYEGKHRDIDKPVAIKVLRNDLSRRPDVVARFRQEAKSASRIGHENIVDVSDFGETRYGSSYFVMEFLEGEDLANVLGREVTVEAQRACGIALQCCRALGAAHAKQIVHRDIKPENIFLIERDGVKDFVKIVDFGIAKMGDIETEGQPGRKLTKTGMIFGTPEYMSPEQAAGKELDHRVDVYALGIILYECLTGRVPFVGDTFMGVLTQHLFSEPPPIIEMNPRAQVSAELELVIAKALAKDPNERYQDTAELADAIECALDGRVSRATAMTPPTGRMIPVHDTDPVPRRRRARWMWPVIAAATAAVLWAWIGDGERPGAEASVSPAGDATTSAAPIEETTPLAVESPTPEEPESLEDSPSLVNVHVATVPLGAQVLHADGSQACASTPCVLETVSGNPLVLHAKLGRRSGLTQITPTQEETVLIVLKAPKRVARQPRKVAEEPKPRRETNTTTRASDLKVPEWAR